MEGKFERISLWDVQSHTISVEYCMQYQVNYAYRKFAYCTQYTCSCSNSRSIGSILFQTQPVSVQYSFCLSYFWFAVAQHLCVLSCSFVYLCRCLAAEPPHDVKNVAWNSSGQSSCPDLEPAVPAPASTTPGGSSVHRQQCKSQTVDLVTEIQAAFKSSFLCPSIANFPLSRSLGCT